MDLGEPITAFARSGFGEYSCPRGSQHKPHLVYRSSQDKGKNIRILHCSKNHPLKIMVMQARILEKQEAVQERKARKKVLFSVLSFTSFNISHAKQANYMVTDHWSGKDIRDTRGSTRDEGCAGDEGAGDPLLHLLQTPPLHLLQSSVINHSSGKFIHFPRVCAGDEGAGDPLLHLTIIFCLAPHPCKEALSLTVHDNICCMNACQLNG